MSDVIAMQVPVVDFFNPDTPSFLDLLVILISFLGNWKFLAPLSVLVFFKDKELGKRLILVFLITSILVFSLKLVVNEERPYITYENIREVGMKGNGNSFPSGHAAYAFAYFTVLSDAFRGKRWHFFVLACLIAFTRLYMGAHYPSDILAGAFFGFFAGLLSIRLNI